MLGLLYKDQTAIWSSYRKNFLLIVLLYTAMSFTMDMPFMLFALVFVSSIYIAATLSFDETSHWDTYARTLPVSPRQIVGAKYLLSLGWMGASFVLAEILLTVCDLIKGQTAENLLFNLAGCLVTLGMVLVYYALTFPLSYKLGAARARSGVIVAIGASIGLVCFAVYTTKNNSGTGMALISATAMDETALLFCVCGGIIGVGTILYCISWCISTVIYAKKEY